MIKENRVSKYILYAIGEIVLVVIGILIALWLNGISQKNSNEQTAKTFLLDFKRDLETDVKTLDEKILINEKMIQNSDSIFILNGKDVISIEESSRFKPWVAGLMQEIYYVPEKTTIRQFESTNSSHLITLKPLKDQLYTYYTTNDLNENNMEKSVQLYQHNFITKDLMGAFKDDDQFESSTNIVAQKLKEDFDLKTAIRMKTSMTRNQNKKYRELQGMARDLVKLIDQELYEEQ